MLKTSDGPLSRAYDCGIYDLDGVCYRGKEPIEHASTSIVQARENGLEPIYLTNNASRKASVVAQQLESLGIPATEENVYTAARAAAELAVTELNPGATIFVIGGPGLREELENHGFVLVDSADDQPDAVVQGFDPSVDWAVMSEGALAIRAGAKFIASNLDSTLPQERGFMLGNGSLVKAVEHATGVTPVATGKPLPIVFFQAASTIGAKHPIAIGDRLNTDIRGAVAGEMDSFHVLTGVSDEIAIATAVPEERPTFLGLDLRDLNTEHIAPAQSGNRFERGAHWADYTDGLHTSSDLNGCDMDLYRCVVAACWNAADNGVDRQDIAQAVADLKVAR